MVKIWINLNKCIDASWSWNVSHIDMWEKVPSHNMSQGCEPWKIKPTFASSATLRAPLANLAMPTTCYGIDEPGRKSPMTNHVTRSSKFMSHHKHIPKPDLHQVPGTSCSSQPLVPNLDLVLNNLHFGTKGTMAMHASIHVSHLP